MNKKIFLLMLILLMSIFLGSVSATEVSCSDSDGNDPSADGSVTTVNSTGQEGTVSDSCYDYGNYAIVTEYYCESNSDGTYDRSTTNYYCDSCLSRNCGTSLSYAYTDSDGGNYSNKPGFTNYTLSITDATGTIVFSLDLQSGSTDYCYSSTSSRYRNNIYEYYLSSSGRVTSSRQSCTTTWGSSYSCIIADGPDLCGIQCTSDSDCTTSGYECGADAVNISGVRVCVEQTSESEVEEITDACADCGAYICDASTSSCYTECTFSGGASNTAVTTECTAGYACSSSLTCGEDADGDTWVDSEEVALGAACDSLEDAECAQGYCDSGLCVECETTAHCAFGETCSSGECVTAPVIEVCTDGSDNDGDSTVDFGGIDTDGDGDIEYIAGCVKRSTFVQYGAATSATNNGCPIRSTYQCQDISTSAFSSCPSGTYISGDSECSMSSTTRASAPETESEQGFWAKLWSWLTGA